MGAGAPRYYWVECEEEKSRRLTQDFADLGKSGTTIFSVGFAIIERFLSKSFLSSKTVYFPIVWLERAGFVVALFLFMPIVVFRLPDASAPSLGNMKEQTTQRIY